MGTVTDMSDVIAELGGELVTVKRYAKVRYSKGIQVAGAIEEFEIIASVQPLTGRELDRLPEGLRAREVRELYTVEKLFTADTAKESGQPPDDVELDGMLWEVQTLEDWNTLAGYFRAVVARKEQT
jgi:hypothetical protein